MGRQKKSCIEKVREQIDRIKDLPTYIKETSSPKDVSYNAHTLLKLSLLSYYIGIFLPIAGKQVNTYGGRIIFIDALAGSGLVKVKDLGENYVVRGSSLIGALSKKPKGGSDDFYYFDIVYSVEKDSSRFSLLKKRFEIIEENERLHPKLVPIYGDINEKIADISQEIKPQDYVLLFIDPEGITETSLATFNSLFKKSKHIDVILNYNDIGALRNLGAGNEDTVKKFVPTQANHKRPIDAVVEYFESIGKEQRVIVRVRSKGNKEEYKILVCVRNTANKAAFLNGFRPYARCIDKEVNAEVLKSNLGGGKKIWF